MKRILILAALVAIVILLGWFITQFNGEDTTEQGLASIQVPEGFAVELAAGPDLVSYPMMAAFDERGRLFVSESTGANTMTTEEMLENPTYRIRMLEDTNHDGIFDKSNVFADKITLPQGGAWHQGALYVSAAPDLLRFEDTNDDGVADKREVVLTGWTLNVNAAVLHGPFLGPDGWLYLTDARRGYEIRTKEGEVLKGKGGRIWRCRPDGTGLEWVSAGGFDNPIELIFTPAGETISTMTYFINPQAGQRDALMHWVEGGVYPKPHSVIEEDTLTRTGDLMPVMTKFARVAPSGLLRYRSTGLGEEYQGNLFSAQFNTHRVLRHIVHRNGATFRTEDQDFLTSTDPDFHPTDVLEDADGSLLVLDTGGWFIKGCPMSRVTKPEFRGAIYRIRKTDNPKVEDPRGTQVHFAALRPQELARYLKDSRIAVRDQAKEHLVRRGEIAVKALAGLLQSSSWPEVRCNAVFSLFQIGTPQAMEEARSALSDPDFQVRIAAARAAGMGKDQAALEQLMQAAQRDEHPAARRQAATALGQIGNPRAAWALLKSAADPQDRFVEHSIIYSLISLDTPEPLIRALNAPSPEVQKAALIALDQMEGEPLKRQHLIPFLSHSDQELRRTSLWVATHHPEWSNEIVKYLRTRLDEPEFSGQEADSVGEVLISFCEDPSAQQAVAENLGNPAITSQRKIFLLDTMNRCPVSPFPESWIGQVRSQLQSSEERVRSRAVQLVRARALTEFTSELERIANDPQEPAALRVAALDALAMTGPELSESQFRFLLELIQPDNEALLRQVAAGVLGQAELNNEQLTILAREHLAQADPLIQSRLVEAFKGEDNPEVGEALVAALKRSSEGLDSYAEQGLRDLFASYPESIQASAQPLIDSMQKRREERVVQLHQLNDQLEEGDVGRGRQIFFGNKVGCSSCHTVGTEGGRVGPDLTSIGAIRSRHDLLEAIVFPSASFVREYEAFRVKTDREMYSGMVADRTPETVVLVTGADSRVRVPRDQVTSMEASSVSIMPEGLDQSLTKEEFADLIAFLEAQKQRPDDGK